MLHIHILLIAPLGTSDMAKPSTDQHEGGIAVREAADHSGAAANYPVETVGTDACPVLARKMVVRQGLINPILNLLGCFLELHAAQFFHHGFSFYPGGFLAFLGMNRLKHLGYQLHLRARRHREHITIKMDRTALVFGIQKPS